MSKTINSISDLIEILKTDFEGFNEDIWFRGQSDFDWKLSPGLLRLREAPSEDALLTRFKQSAGILINASPKNDFEWLFLMQHYGIPTRLLDWTENPLTALYFAVTKEDNDDKDAALWSLKPTELNKIDNISTNEKNFIPSFDDDELKMYSIEKLSSNLRNKLAPIATRNSPRIQAQLGVYTIHHLDNKAVEEFCSKEEVFKYKVPAASRENIRKELELQNINQFTLFPKLSSICETIKQGLK